MSIRWDSWTPNFSNILRAVKKSKLDELAATYSTITGSQVTVDIHKDRHQWKVVFDFHQGKNRLSLCLTDYPFQLPTTRIEYIYLAPQRQGLGTKVISALLPCLRSLGFKRVVLNAGDINVVRFWEKVGFRRLKFNSLDMFLNL